MSPDASPGDPAQAARRPAPARDAQTLITGQGADAESTAEPGDAVAEERHFLSVSRGLPLAQEAPAERPE
jgi:hypothetical protein